MLRGDIVIDHIYYFPVTYQGESVVSDIGKCEILH